jgi:CRISPR type III-A-associated RAMP protein Csm5
VYIPGSSIKGAIVSAIVGESRAELSLPANIRSKNNSVAERLFAKPTVNKNGEIKYDPKNSNLRFLRVSDAYFDNADIAIVECYGLNLRERSSLIDNKARMLVECINAEQQASVHIQIKTELQKQCSSAVPSLPEAMQSEDNLLNTINAHTIRLLKEELIFWNEQENRTYYHIDTDEEQEELEYYLDYIKYALRESNRCQNNCEAIIRVGYGSGWRFMTGSWIDEGGSEWEKIAAIVRNDRGDRYKQYDFPKTRRVGLGTPFGFIKITKVE